MRNMKNLEQLVKKHICFLMIYELSWRERKKEQLREFKEQQQQQKVKISLSLHLYMQKQKERVLITLHTSEYIVCIVDFPLRLVSSRIYYYYYCTLVRVWCRRYHHHLRLQRARLIMFMNNESFRVVYAWLYRINQMEYSRTCLT